MSHEASLIFFGVRFSIGLNEISNAEDRTLPIVQKARSVGLQFYWEDFGVDEPRYYGFIGKRLGILGVENDAEVALTASDVEGQIKTVCEKLRAAGIEDQPRLYAQWMPPKG